MERLECWQNLKCANAPPPLPPFNMQFWFKLESQACHPFFVHLLVKLAASVFCFVEDWAAGSVTTWKPLSTLS